MRTEIIEIGKGVFEEFEIDESERSASERAVILDAWGVGVGRLEGFAAAVGALVPPGHRSDVHFHCQQKDDADGLLPEELIARVGRVLGPDTRTRVVLRTPVPWQQSTAGSLSYQDDHYGPCMVSFGAWDLFPKVVQLATLTGPRSAAMDAATTALATLDDMEDLFLRLCAPKHIVTGTAVSLDHVAVAPIERCASYHADAAAIARDLALSWIFLYESSFVHRLAALPLGELAAHVESAPAGARVGVGARWRLLVEYPGLDARDRPEPRPPWDPADQARKGPRTRLPGEAELTREEVLAALATPRSMLLEALDACAVPDAEWRAAEPDAREILKATKAGAPSEVVWVNTDEHTHWIEQHAPYHVRRLPSGGVLLATHPYRVLWPLWADALSLLGIRETG